MEKQKKQIKPYQTISRNIADIKLDENMIKKHKYLKEMKEYVLQKPITQIMKLELIKMLDSNEIQNMEEIDEEIKIAKEVLKLEKSNHKNKINARRKKSS